MPDMDERGPRWLWSGSRRGMRGRKARCFLPAVIVSLVVIIGVLHHVSGIKKVIKRKRC